MISISELLMACTLSVSSICVLVFTWKQIIKKDEEINKKNEKLIVLRNNNKELVSNLKFQNYRYHVATGSLHIRGLFESYENLLNNTWWDQMSEEERTEWGATISQTSLDRRTLQWEQYINCDGNIFRRFRECIAKQNLDLNSVPNIASELYNTLNDAEHCSFIPGVTKLVLCESKFKENELQLLLSICDDYIPSRCYYVVP